MFSIVIARFLNILFEPMSESGAMGSPFAKVTKDVGLLVSYLLNMVEEDEVCSISSLKIYF
jgi:hypothetical protein